MSIYQPAPAPWPSRVLSIVRIVFAFFFISFGTMKIFGYPHAPMPMPPFPAFSQIWFAGWMEIIGGALILVGLFTRPVAFILAGEMAVAYFQGHFPQGFWPSQNGGIGAGLYCWFFLYLVFAGAGEWSVDAAIARRRGLRTGS